MSLKYEPSSEPLHISAVQGYRIHKKLPPPLDYRRALGIGLLYSCGVLSGHFLKSEVQGYLTYKKQPPPRTTIGP